MKQIIIQNNQFNGFEPSDDDLKQIEKEVEKLFNKEKNEN